MKQTITKQMFIDAFKTMDRQDNFSYDGLCALYDNLEEHEDDYELDVIAICCAYAEDELAQVLQDYNLQNLDELHGKTYVVWEDKGCVLYQQF